MTATAIALPSRSTSELAWFEIGAGVSTHPAAYSSAARRLLTDRALRLLASLHRELEGERDTLLRARLARQQEYDSGALPDYLDRDSEAVVGNWRVAEIPPELRVRRVEITGPVHHPKMVINMLSRNAAGDRADTAMLDFEDSMKPTWENIVQGVHNVIAVARGTLSFVRPATADRPDKIYTLDGDDMALPMVRVRGLHLEESNLRVDGQPIAAGLLDFALCLLHAGPLFVRRGLTPTFYVPKTEHYLESRWWNRLFVLGQRLVGLEPGTLRATFLIETLPAALQMEEILYEVRQHAAGLNVGRWDKIFSDIKVLKFHPDRVLADRSSIGMEQPWMRAYAQRLIQICHRRGAFAIGGMAAFTPGRDADMRAAQSAKVKADKEFEASLGHDGCWVSHPYFIGIAKAAFKSPNQLDITLAEVDPYPDLIPAGGGWRTLDGLRTNLRVGIAYLKGWQEGVGCVAWDHLMEDLATLEISRAQTWQWLQHGATLDSPDGALEMNRGLVARIFAEQLEVIHRELNAAGQSDQKAAYSRARDTAEALFTRRQFSEFMTRSSEFA